MHIPNFRLYRMGSDPEALFVKPVDFDWIITPAYEVLGRDKKKTTASFIGTDSRPVIAEIRPNPARNLKRHLYELAYAVVTMQDHLDHSAKWKGTKLLAYPHIHGENLGGHIHASMFIDDPLYVKIAKYGYTAGAGGQYLASIGGLSVPGLPQTLELELSKAYQHGQIVTPQAWGLAMGYLLTPFEKWIQPWVAREKRNAHYGAEISPDAVRLGVSVPPFASDLAYIHWEYRLPSTWLQHPWLAYAYLGLAKLSVLNMRRVFELWADEYSKSAKKKHGDDEGLGELASPTTFTVLQFGDPATAGEQFRQRCARLLPGARFSRDLSNLMKVIEQCNTARSNWFNKPTPVDVEAWRKLL